MIRAAISGRLGRDVEQRTTKTGKQMTTASIAVDVGRPGEDQAIEWFNVIAFGGVAEILGVHIKGDLVDAMGQLQRSTFTDRRGAERANWTLIAEQVLSARIVKAARSPRRRSPYPRLAAVGNGPPLPDDRVDDLWRDGVDR
jgi:single-strand DNA-binding protein